MIFFGAILAENNLRVPGFFGLFDALTLFDFNLLGDFFLAINSGILVLDYGRVFCEFFPSLPEFGLLAVHTWGIIVCNGGTK